MTGDLSRRFYWRAAPMLAPGITDSQYFYEQAVTRLAPGSARWLELGCGHHILPPWRFEEEKQLVQRAQMIVGLDYDLLSLTKHRTIANRVRGSITKLPFPSDTFDLVTSNMVFEHLDNPASQLQEIYRVLKPGGSPGLPYTEQVRLCDLACAPRP